MPDPDPHTRTLSLRDGRTLGWTEVGDPYGRPVLYFGGGNNSRLEAVSYHRAARSAGVRLIATDRPGFGLSTFQPARRFLDWPDDVVQLADALELDLFFVMGLSGGGPHALATCFALPQRVRRAAVVSGAAPPDTAGRFDGVWPPIRVLYALARWLPTSLLRGVQRAMTDPDRNFTPQNIARMRPPDAEILTRRPELLREIAASMREAHRQGYDGAAWEWKLYTRSWGFPLEGIATPVDLWYGEHDGNAPPAMGRGLHRTLPDSRLQIVPDEAHLSLVNNHGERILAALVGAPAAAADRRASAS